MLDKTTVREIANRYIAEVKKTYSPQSIILFGSHVNGTAHEYSDIDIAIVFDGFQGNWLEASTHLVGIAWDMGSDIEPHIMDTTADKSGFVDYVYQHGEVLFLAS